MPSDTDFVIVTGLSGAGRSTAANVIEDRGWYVVDNLPPQLLGPMAELASSVRDSGVTGLRIAAVVDVRARAFRSEVQAGLAATVPVATYVLAVWALHYRDKVPGPMRSYAAPVAAALVLVSSVTPEPVLVSGAVLAALVALSVVVQSEPVGD